MRLTNGARTRTAIAACFLTTLLSASHPIARATRLVPRVQGGSECAITCPPNQTAVATSPSGAVVTYPAPTTSADCVTTCTPSSGSTFPVGTTTVSCVASTTDVPRRGGLPPGPTLTPEVEPDDTFEQATPIDLSAQPCAVGYGAVAPAGDVDYFKIVVPAGSHAWLDLDTGFDQNPGSTTRDSLLTIYNADGSVVERDDDDGTSTGEGIGVISTESSSISGVNVGGGAYFLGVEAKRTSQMPGVINPYKLYLVVTSSEPFPEVEPANDSPVTATPIVTGSGQTGLYVGAAGDDGDEDWYSVQPAPGDVIFVSLDCDFGRVSQGADLTFELTDNPNNPPGSYLPVVDSSGAWSETDPASETVVNRPDEFGTYYVVVRGKTGKPDPYQLMVSTCSAGSGSPTCTFTVKVTMPFAGCCVDDFSGDTYSTTVGNVPASDPLYGFWEYHVAATGETLSGTANRIAYRPNVSLVMSDNDDPRFFMSEQMDYARHTCLVQLTDRATNRRFTLRDRDTRNSACTMPPP